MGLRPAALFLRARLLPRLLFSRVLRQVRKCYPAHRPIPLKMIRCHLSTLMGRDKLRIAEVARQTGLNRSTVTALYRETATRVDLDAVESLCRLFRCSVGDLFEVVPDLGEGAR